MRLNAFDGACRSIQKLANSVAWGMGALITMYVQTASHETLAFSFKRTLGFVVLVEE